MTMQIRFLSRKKISKKYLEHIAKTSLKVMKKKNSEISLVFVGETRMRNLNRIYRKKDKVTDVLSFGNESGKKDKFIYPADAEENLGEIFICTNQAEKQAEEKGHSLKKEITILLVHGLLHLIGFDHESYEDEKRMKEKEGRIIAKCNC